MGAEKLVPARPPLEPVGSYESGTEPTMPTPGAVRSMPPPAVENDATPSLWSFAPTVSTCG